MVSTLLFTASLFQTTEFRQHSGTHNKMKIKNWIRLCVAFVHNSARFRTPVVDDEIFEMLFMYMVKDRFLRDFYRQRRIDVVMEHSLAAMAVPLAVAVQPTLAS